MKNSFLRKRRELIVSVFPQQELNKTASLACGVHGRYFLSRRCNISQ